MPTEETYTTCSPEETRQLGLRLAERLSVGDCVALAGPLGAGKTVLVRGLAEGLGLGDGRLVSSPTYVLVQEYPAQMPVFHLDLYRLVEPSAELGELGLEEMLAEGVVVVEWAQRASEHLPRPLWRIDIAPTGLQSRVLTLVREC